MNEQDLRDYRAYLNEQLAIMAKATAGPWVSDADEYCVFGKDDTVVAECYYNEPEVDDANREAVAASGNGYPESLRAQLRMLDALEAIFQAASSTAGLVSIITLHKCSEATTVALLDIIAAWKGGRA
jgi:hypothetical protein